MNDHKNLKFKIKNLYDFHFPRLEKYNRSIDYNDTYEDLIKISNEILTYSAPVWKIINEAGKTK